MPQQQRILQMGQTMQKTVPRLVSPQHVTTVHSNPMPRVRANRPRLAGTIQQTPRMVSQSPVRVSGIWEMFGLFCLQVLRFRIRGTYFPTKFDNFILFYSHDT